MSKALRRKMVDELAESFKGQGNLFLVGVQGLTANQAVELRAQVREGKGRVKVVKNAIALHTFRKLGLAAFEKHLGGMNAVVYGPDPLVMAKKLVAYRDKNQRAEVKFALVEGKVMDPAAVTALSKLPGREQILASLLGTLNAVTQKFVSTLNEIPRSFVGTLKAVSEKK
jgi:large subunit ribosomal protein L10